MKRRTLSLIVIATAVIGWWQRDYLRGYAAGSSADLDAILQEHPSPDAIGLIRFVYDDMGSLNTDALQTHATPWKVVTAALLLTRSREMGLEVEDFSLEHVNEILRGFGFVVPDRIANWSPQVPVRRFDRPIGIVTGQVRRRIPAIDVELANLGCASCHGGVIYDADGDPTRDIWLGLPNTSLNLEAFTTAAYEGLKGTIAEPALLLAAIQVLYPDVSEGELSTLARFVLPRIETRLRELSATIDAPAPYSNGSPGLTNGIAALKWTMGMLDGNSRASEVAFTSIPELGGTALRTSLLYDGIYGITGRARFAPRATVDATDDHLDDLAAIVSFFTVPTMGVTPAIAEESIPRAEDIFRFVASYDSPPFPGAIDSLLAREGSAVYRASCQGCHGTFSPGLDDVRLTSFPNRHVRLSEIGTDPVRAAPNDELFAAIRQTEFVERIDPAATGGYVAMPLTGIWATSPYLHNGSVPSLWHLMHPDRRPERFYVGGHRLDWDMLGIDGEMRQDGVYGYPPGYTPWATPYLYDTRRRGMHNAGHAREFEALREEQKRALLEYLKVL